jgi:hypothetical protein
LVRASSPASHGGRRIEETLDRYSSRERDRIVDQTAKKYGLTDAERERVFEALTEVENAKSKEFWEKRGPMEAMVLVGRTAAGTGMTVAAGLAAPSTALFPAAMSSLIAIGAQLAVLYRKLGHALYGRAAVEVSRIDRERDAEPLDRKKGRLHRLVERWAERVVKKYAARYGLDDAQRALVATKVEEAALSKKVELWNKRLPVEVGASVGASVITAFAGVALGLIAAPGVGVLALSALFGSLISVGLSVRKLRANLEATAYAEVQALAQDDPESKFALQVALEERAGVRSACRAAERVGEKYAVRYSLTPNERSELEAILESLARLKEKELFEQRLLPTLAAPLARGGSVAAVASMIGLVGVPTATALLIAAVAESAASGVILYKSLNPALEGAAYAYVLERGADPEATSDSEPPRRS